MSHNTPPATPEERIAALEELVLRLMEVLEGEEKFSMDALTRWIGTCREAERRHQIADARAQVVFAQLCERLQLVDDDLNQEDTDPAAQQAARTAIDKSRQPPKG